MFYVKYYFKIYFKKLRIFTKEGPLSILSKKSSFLSFLNNKITAQISTLIDVKKMLWRKLL
jgi:hypothetical protein